MMDLGKKAKEENNRRRTIAQCSRVISNGKPQSGQESNIGTAKVVSANRTLKWVIGGGGTLGGAKYLTLSRLSLKGFSLSPLILS